jgi:hypothetical protein
VADYKWRKWMAQRRGEHQHSPNPRDDAQHP